MAPERSLSDRREHRLTHEEIDLSSFRIKIELAPGVTDVQYIDQTCVYS